MFSMFTAVLFLLRRINAENLYNLPTTSLTGLILLGNKPLLKNQSIALIENIILPLEILFKTLKFRVSLEATDLYLPIGLIIDTVTSSVMTSW